MTDGFDVERTLAPLRRAMTVRKLVRWTVAGAGLGALSAAFALATLRARGASPAAPVFLCALVPVLAAVLSLILRPGLDAAARRADTHFELNDRLTTALEFRTSTEPLVLLQRSQTGAVVAGKRLRSGAGTWIAPRELAAAVLAIAVASALFAAPTPPASHASPASGAELARIRHLASEQIPAMTRDLPRGDVKAMRQARHVLARLRRQLRAARTRAQALRAISLAQQQLAHIAARIQPVDRSSAAALAHTLGRYVPEHRGPPNLQAAKALSSIARNLQRANASQKSRIARDLLKAANAARDARTRSLLHKAASALGQGDKRHAQSALRKAAQRLRSGSSARKARSGLAKTQKGLDAAKYNLTASHNGKLQGASLGNEKSKYSHERANSAAPSRRTTSNRRVISRAGKASALNGKRNLAESGQPSDSGGYSLGQQQDASGNGKPRRFGVVYLKGKLTQGTYNVQEGPTGQVQRQVSSSYQHVVARYARSAQEAVDRASLPPSLQTYVRRYFVVLTHP